MYGSIVRVNQGYYSYLLIHWIQKNHYNRTETRIKRTTYRSLKQSQYHKKRYPNYTRGLKDYVSHY